METIMHPGHIADILAVSPRIAAEDVVAVSGTWMNR
jgi:hypothetical protein